jgi:hypothetical protein
MLTYADVCSLFFSTSAYVSIQYKLALALSFSLSSEAISAARSLFFSLRVAEAAAQKAATQSCCLRESIRQHTSAYVSIRQHAYAERERQRQQHRAAASERAYVSMRQHTSAYVCGEREAEAATQRVYLPERERERRERERERERERVREEERKRGREGGREGRRAHKPLLHLNRRLYRH